MSLDRPATPTSILCYVVLLGTLAVPPATIAEDAVPLEPSADAKEAAYEKQMICKRQAVVGTKISKKVCVTRAQADAQRANSQEFLDSAQKAGAIQTTTKQ